MTSVTDVVVIGAGQSGLAATRSLQTHGISLVVLEAGPEPAGSWLHYYDSLTLFSPARYSAMPGLDFPGEPGHYPHRDEVASYLRRYAASLGADIRTNTPVTAVEAHGQAGFLVYTATGQTIHAAGVVAATGSFANPYVPALPGQDHFTGRLLHVADYRSPHQHAGERVIVVGAGNSAVQVGYELAQAATVTLATRHPVTFYPQCRGGQDLHYWLVTTGFDLLPPEWLRHYLGDRWVVRHGQVPPRPGERADGPPPNVHRVRHRRCRLAGRNVGEGGHRRVRHRLPPPPGLPQPTGRPRRWWHAPARRRHFGHPPRPGLPRAGVPAVVLLQHLARRAPRRRACDPAAGRPRAQRPSRRRPISRKRMQPGCRGAHLRQPAAG